MRSTNLTASALALGLATAPLAAAAGGPFQPPDGVGNPGGGDYTGYNIHGWILGVVENPRAYTRILCANFGTLPATDVIVQFFDGTNDPSRGPVSDVRLSNDLPLADIGRIRTDEPALIGRIPASGITRILVADSSPKHDPALECRAFVQDKFGRNTVAELPIERPAPKKKKKKRRR